MLYIFGDSFSTPDDQKTDIVNRFGLVTYSPLEKNWTSIVSEDLIGTSDHVNLSVLGCSNEYIFHKLCDRSAYFKSGDCIIIQLTSFYREWLFEDKPHMGNFMTTKFTPGVDISKEVVNALELYKKYLYSDHRLAIHYNAIIDAITLRTQLFAKQNVRCLIIPGFHKISGVEGTLFDASNLEFDCQKTAMDFYTNTADNRYNHFSEINHKVLANKVIEFFRDFKTVDLTTDFKTNIFDKENI
jgi:hypothetical protein